MWATETLATETRRSGEKSCTSCSPGLCASVASFSVAGLSAANTAMNAIEAREVHKVYRRYGRRKQFATLKSALLSGNLVRDLRPDDDLRSAQGRVVRCRPGQDLRHRRTQRIRQEHDAQADRRHRQADLGHRARQRPRVGTDRAGCRLSSGNLRPRERLHQRPDARPQPARDLAAVRRHRPLRGDPSSSSTRR